MTIAGKIFLSCFLLGVVVIVAALVEISGPRFNKWVRLFLGALVIVVAVGFPVSGIAWIWGW